MLRHNFKNPLCPYNHIQFTKVVGNLRMSLGNWKHKVIENYNTFGSFSYVECSIVTRNRWLLLLMNIMGHHHLMHHLLSDSAPHFFAFPCLITNHTNLPLVLLFKNCRSGPQKLISRKYICNKFHFQAQVSSWALIKISACKPVGENLLSTIWIKQTPWVSSQPTT